MKIIELNEIKAKLNEYKDKNVKVAGWIKTIRSSKEYAFIEINDGSTFLNTQIVAEKIKLNNFDKVVKYRIGSAIIIEGNVILTPNQKQPYEINSSNIILEGDSADDFPLQKKRHSVDFLREIAHLRPRTNLYRAIFKIRSEAIFAIHKFFSSRNFVCVSTPIITGSDCEGAGDMFKVTTHSLEDVPKNSSGEVDYTKDFFGKETHLSVSGQLNVETFAMAFSKVYTFGPTFRAENSNTSRHASEFWMLEPEIAFADLNDNIALAQDMLKYLVSYILDNCKDEMSFLDQFVEKGLKDKLRQFINSDYSRITYTEAIDLLKEDIRNGVAPAFEYPVEWGKDLKSEHERYLTEKIFKGPVTVTDYPKDIKAFYMRLNDDGKTVAAMDLLVPGVGEMIGGSQREERLDMLTKRIKDMGFDVSDYDWYLDLRKYGTAKHSGFGLGFDRFLMYVTGINNIRDTIPFPRTPKNSKY